MEVLSLSGRINSWFAMTSYNRWKSVLRQLSVEELERVWQFIVTPTNGARQFNTRKEAVRCRLLDMREGFDITKR